MTTGEAQTSSGETPVEEPSNARAKRPPERKAPEPGEVLTVLRQADLLPCLYFLPGRRVVEEAPVGELFGSPAHPYTRGLLKSLPGAALVAGTPVNRLPTIAGMVPPITNLPKGC